MMKNNYEIYPKNLVAQNMVFQNMSNHYRRIYNAKPRIDTRRPTAAVKSTKIKTEAKKSTNGSWINNRSPSYLDEVDKKRMTYRQFCAEKSNYMIHQYDDIIPYQPRILKTNVESKVRNLQVYHPPRRRLPVPIKQQIRTQSTPELEKEIDEEQEEKQWIQTIKPVEERKTHQSKPCSSDSAYTEEGEVGWSGGESRGATPIEVNTLPSTPVLEWTSSQRSYRSDDSMYVRFLREITEEVLRKGVFTNRALKQIFQDHIKANKYNLEVVRMQEEIEKLRIELAIPKEDYMNDADFGLGSDRCLKTVSSEIINFPDKELLEALNQLDISEELKVDVANSLGLRPSSNQIAISRQSSRVRKDLHIQLPSSDEYEVSSECSESSRNSSTDHTL